MESTAQIVLMVSIGLIVLIGFWMAHAAAQKRRDALWALANELELAFDPHKDEPDSQHSLFGEFKRGHSRRVLNTMRGDLEFFARPCPCVLGDYEYKVTSGSGKNRQTSTHRFSYLLVRIPWAVPNFSIRRENLLDKIAGAIGFDDIDFESEEFSRRFHVKCTDKKFAYGVVHPRMMEYLLGTTAEPIEFAGAWCLISDGRGRWNPETFRSTVAFARQFFGHWPEHLVTDLETRRASAGMSTL